jgi:hypothetical protein
VDHSCSTCSISFTLLLGYIEVGNVLKNFLVDDLHLFTRQLRYYFCQILDGLRLDCIVLRLDLLHECLSHNVGDLLISVKVNLARQYEFCKPLCAHLHVVRVVVTHLTDQLVDLLFTHFCHRCLFVSYLIL